MSTLWSGEEWEPTYIACSNCGRQAIQDETCTYCQTVTQESIPEHKPYDFFDGSKDNFFIFLLKSPFYFIYAIWMFFVAIPQVTMEGLPLGTQNPTRHRP